MRVAFDLRPSLSKPTGVGAYVLALARRLPIVAPEAEFIFFSASVRERYPDRRWPGNVRLVDRHLPVRALNFAWNRLGWPPIDLFFRGEPVDLVHSPHPLIVPGRKAKHIVTLHDLFFLKHPEWTRAEIRRDYVPLVREHARRADGVICVSEYTAAEARLLLELPEEKIAVIPNGIDPIFKDPIPEAEIEAVLARRRLRLDHFPKAWCDRFDRAVVIAHHSPPLRSSRTPMPTAPTSSSVRLSMRMPAIVTAPVAAGVV